MLRHRKVDLIPIHNFLKTLNKEQKGISLI